MKFFHFKLYKLLIKSVLVLSAAILLSLKFAPPALATVYQPGETLNPVCSPTDSVCRVATPAASGANSDITSLTGITTPLPVTEGGIGLSSVPTGALIYGSASNTFSALAIGTTSQVLTVNGSGLPIWTTISVINPGTTSSNTLRWNGTNWVESGALTNNGTNIIVSNNLTVGGTFVSVGSTNLVSNLNANYLGGTNASGYVGVGQTGSLLYVNNATDNTLTRSGSGPYTLGLNLGASNTWTGLQTFGNIAVGSTNLVSNFNANYLGGIPSSGFDNYNHWTLQTNGAGSTNVLTANTVNFINGVGVSLSQSGSSVTFNIGQNVRTTDSPSFSALALTSSSNQLDLGTSGSKTTISANTQISNRIVTIPAMSSNDTFVFNNFGATLTNKTISASNNTITGLTTNNLSAGASIAITQLANPNITIETLSGSGLQGGGTVGLGGTLSLSFVSVATAGTYGSASQIPVITIDQHGSVTGVTPTTIFSLTNANLSAAAGITNAQLANSSISINPVAGTGIGISGSPVSLGGSLNISGINATSSVKGVASFDATNFLVTSGAVNTIQDINTAATPTFNSTTLTNRLFITSTSNQLSLGATNTTTISATAPSASRTAIIPGLTVNDTFAFIGQTQTFTNKTIDANSNTISNLTNSNLSGTAGIIDANLATITTSNKVLGSAVQLNTNGGIGNSSGLTLLRTCADNQILKWTASGGWACAADATGGTPAVYSNGGLLSDGTGLSLLRTCADNQILKWTAASGWFCASDNTGGGSLTVEQSNHSVSVSPVTELQFGSTLNSTDEFIVSDIGSSIARVRAGNKIVQTDAPQTLTGKTITGIGNTITGLTNSNLLSGSAAITDNNLATITSANKVSGSAIQLAAGGGLVNNSGLSLLTTCADGNILAWNSGSSSWGCVSGGSPPINNLIAATATNIINNTDFAQVWDWDLTTAAKTAFTFGENVASTNGAGSQYILGVSTKAGSTAAPLKIVAQNNTIIDTTALGGITIGSQTAGQPINILSGAGDINIGTGAFAKTISIGTITGATTLNMATGTGGFSLNGLGSSSYSIGTSTTSGTIIIGGVAQTGDANLFTGTGGMNINIGTGNGANVISIGNTTTTTGIHLHTGSGNIHTRTDNGNGMQFLTNTSTDDSLRIAPGLNDGAASFQGTITSADLTAARTWTFQNNSGYIPLSTSGNSLFFTTTGNTSLTLPTSGTVTALGNNTTGSGTTLVLSTSPTFSTSIIDPLVIGGAVANNTLTLAGNNALTGNTTTNQNINFNVGDSNATTAMTILNNGYVGIGTTAPVGPLEVVVQNDFLYITKYSNDSFSPGVVDRKARGTSASPQPVQYGDRLGTLGGRGYDGTGFPTGVVNSSGVFQVVAAETFSPTAKGTYLGFIITPAGSTTRAEKMRLDTTGTLQLLNTTNQLSFGDVGSSAPTTTISSIAPAANRTLTIPGIVSDDTFVFIGQTQTLTNKTISGTNNTLSNIGNASLTNSSLTVAIGTGLSGGGTISLGSTATVALNLGSSNVWTGLQTFAGGIGVTGNSNFTNNLTVGTTLTASNGLVLTTGALSLTATSGILSLSGLSASSITTGAGNNLTLSTGTTGNLTLDSGTVGSILIGTNANAKTLSIGNTVGNTTVNITSGTGGINIGTEAVDKAINIGNTTGSSAITLASGTGGINIGIAPVSKTISIGTGGGSNTINIGTTFGGATLTLISGTGGINIGTLAVGKTIAIGTGAANNTINIGTTFGGSATNITSGTGNINFNVGGNNISGKVIIGNSGTTTPDLLVLDNGTTDPTGTNGAMYYNSTLGKFRCFENSTWVNCVTRTSDLQHTAVYPADDTNIAIGTGATTTVSTISITPSTTTGDVYVRASVFAISGNNTDQVLHMYLANGTCAAGTTIASNTTTVAVQSGIIAGSIDISAVVTNPGTSALTFNLCAFTTGQTTNLRLVEMTADVIDTGADLAEMYTTNDTTMEIGDVVSLDPLLQTGVRKSTVAYDQSVFGVISTKPGLLIGNVGSEGVKALPVALSGRVPVKVNTQNGPIHAGDPLTTSSTPGVAMKATKSGVIIGTAMTDYDGPGVGKILVFVKNSQTNGAKTDSNLTSSDILSSLIQQNSQIVPATINLSEITTDKAVAGVEMISPKITTQDIFTANASISGTLTANNIKANNIIGLDQIIDQKINDLIGNIKIASGSMTVNDFESSGSAKFIGSVEFHGPAIFKNISEFFDTVIFHNRVIFADKDMGGVAVIKQSTSEIEVKFDKSYEQVPILNVSLVYEGTDSPTFVDEGKKFTVAYLNRDGFKIILSDIAVRDFEYNWIALAVKDAKTSVSNIGPVESIPTLEPTPTPTETPSPTPEPTSNITPTP